MSLQNAFIGSLAADAFSMPMHWYYDVNALDADYGSVTGYHAPLSPHPDSILWRSIYSATGPKADILHDQKEFWGKRGIHYHQSLKAGENTLNLQLSAELYRHILAQGAFKLEAWLRRYAEVMLTPGWHNDTYAEEYHRAFFQNYAGGKPLISCGTKDYHIGALSMIPGLLAGLEATGTTVPAAQLESVLSLVRSTHNHPDSLRAATDLTRILSTLAGGASIRDTISQLSLPGVSIKKLLKWESFEDRKVVGNTLSTACYLPESFLASLHFAWKYHDDFSAAILANARVGGDNCHRGVVLGSIIACSHGVPDRWLDGLLALSKTPSLQFCDSRPQILNRAS